MPVNDRTQQSGLKREMRLGVFPVWVGVNMKRASSSRAASNASMEITSSMAVFLRRRLLLKKDSIPDEGAAVFLCRSTVAAIFAIILTASAGYFPMALSSDSITASVPSRIALATSVTSARVGRIFSVIDSSICVAVMTGRPRRLAFRINFF
ncbi:hypothetical protein BMS3Abin05_01022 [bacterium BMS3Abin05]|nr:hypothetical protein BMS3Abin05_01022 [bacterium BMS3Abin05]